MADFDIFNAPKSEVFKGIEGKLMLIHSQERKLGKTWVGAHMPKPFYLRFEQGINAISGIPYAALNSWSDFKKVNKQLTNPKTLEEARKLYTTIIFDTTDVAIKWCEKYVCASQGVDRLNDGNSGYGLWKEYENEWFGEISKLINAGYFVYFIAHSEEKTLNDPVDGSEYTCMCPKGDKRTIDLILDSVDFIGYVKSNGISEEGEVIPSSVYFANTKEFQAGSRFKYMPKKIEVFSADNVQKAIADAVEKEEKESGIKGTDFKQRKAEEKPTMNYDEILSAIKPYVQKLVKTKSQDVQDIIEKYLGAGIKVSEATKKQTPQLEMILFDLQQLDKE